MGNITDNIMEFKATYVKVSAVNNWPIWGPVLGWGIFEFACLTLVSDIFPDFLNAIGGLCLIGGFVLIIPIFIFSLIYAKKIRVIPREECDIVAKFMCENNSVIYIDNDNYISGDVMDDTVENLTTFFVARKEYIAIKEEDRERFINFLDTYDVDYERIFD